MRPYALTHPWISFRLDLSQLDSATWMHLGEAESKCEHIAGVPLRPGVARQLNEVYLAKGALATTAIEGNTLTEADARKIVEGSLEISKSKEYLRQEIQNIIDACRQISADNEDTSGELSVALLRDFNRSVLKGIPLDDHVVPGEIRNVDVGVARYKAPPHQQCQDMLEELCEWLNSELLRDPEDHAIPHALIRAVVAHLYIAWIHPFGDGNGRTARLVEYFILVNAGVPIPSAQLLSNHYNHTRTEYYRQLAASSANGGDVRPFIKYAVQGFIDGLKEQLKTIRAQQWDVTWINYVHQCFRDKNSPADVRRRHVVLDLRNKEIHPSELRTLTPRLAELYLRKHDRSISRDVNDLLKMDLLEKRPEGKIRAKRNKILAFLPPRRIRAKVKAHKAAATS